MRAAALEDEDAMLRIALEASKRDLHKQEQWPEGPAGALRGLPAHIALEAAGRVAGIWGKGL